jgi:hypothetical protein
MDGAGGWPALPWKAWKDSCDTLHLWTQVVGKVKLALSPFLNEFWNVGFELTARGLTTGTVPYERGAFSIDFDFIDHTLAIKTSAGARAGFRLMPCSVADFYGELMAQVRNCGIDVEIHPVPVEMPNPIPFAEDVEHASYDGEYVHRWWRIMLGTSNVLMRYRSAFAGKSSPVLFYWGSFDLTTTRYSGRPAPRLVTGPRFVQIAEDQENVACGFWPGNANAAGVELGEPAFYSYIYPAPPGYRDARLRPASAEYADPLGEFILRYDQIREATAPDALIMEFLNSAYGTAATLAGWDRARLEPALDQRMRPPRPAMS